jgi:hypothetical protein
MKKIMIGCPISIKRDWCLPFYLQCLDELDYPKENLHVSFLYNYPEDKGPDRTLEILEDFESENFDKYRKIETKVAKTNYEDWRIPTRSFDFFAAIRNEWLKMADKKDQYYMNIDSDILFKPHTLNELLKWNKNVVSGLIQNPPLSDGSPGFNVMAKMEGMYHRNGDNMYTHLPIRTIRINGIWKFDQGLYKLIEPPIVGVAGAMILFSKKIIDEGVKFGYHTQGEDIYFCEEVRKKGYEVYTDCTLYGEHLLSPDQLEDILGDKVPPGYILRPPAHNLVNRNIQTKIEFE